MTTYLALLRGVNVGGNGLIKMSELKLALEKAGLEDVQTYIQSGNVIFKSSLTNEDKLVSIITSTIHQQFDLSPAVALFSAAEWRRIIKAAPTWWGRDEGWRHNLLAVIKPSNAQSIVADIGKLVPDAEAVAAGKGVIYQSVDRNMIGRTATGSKLISNSVYKKITIRNYNTATKLLTLLDEQP